MTEEELEKKAEESYAKQLKDSSYYETGEEGAYICGYITGVKELETEYMLKLKDTSLVRALKDSIIMNEKLSSQEQQELCAWIEAAMEFGENLDECAKENEQLKAQVEKMRSEAFSDVRLFTKVINIAVNESCMNDKEHYKEYLFSKAKFLLRGEKENENN